MLKKFWPVILFFISFNLISARSIQITDPEINFDDYAVNLVDYTLPNGLRVILAEDHSAPVVAVDIWYHAGSANDPEGRAGFAHLFEHLLFRGSAHVEDGDYDIFLEAVGAENNAYTVDDYTAYWVMAPAHELPRVLWLESDRMASLQLTEEIFEAERDVVIQEYNEGVLNTPYGMAFERLYTLPFQGYLPYERPVIGNPDDLKAASLEEVQQFFDTYYKPNNATLAIVGDIDLEVTRSLVAAYFGDIPATAEVTPILEQYPLPDFPVERTDADSGCNIGWEETLIDPMAELPLFIGAVVGPPRGTSDFYALDLLSLIMGNGDSSRFYQNIISQGLAVEAELVLELYTGASLLNGYIIPNPEETAEEAQALFRAELQRVIEEGVTEEELARAKQQIKVDTLTAFRASTLDTAEMLQEAILYFDDPKAMGEDLERYEAVTLADIDRVAQTYLCEAPLNMITALPEGEEVTVEHPGPLMTPVAVTPAATPTPMATPETLAELPEGVVNRTGVPASLPLSEGEGLAYETFELDNGLKVIFVEQHELPKLHLQLYVGGSQVAVPAEQQGLAELTAELLTKGTTTRSATEIAEQIESKGGYLSAGADIEWLLLEADALITEAPLAFELLADVARNPTFPQEEFEVAQEQSLSVQLFNEADPNFLADRQFYQVAFGDHPYGFSMTPESLEALSREDVVDFYQTYFKPNNALLVITADMTLEEARRQAEQVFEDWPAEEVPNFLDQPQAVTGETGVIYLVDLPDAQQATLRVGNLTIAASNPDRYGLELVHTTLGGSFFARLNMNLRANKGFTYGVYSDLDRLSDVGAFLISTDVDQEHAGEALQEILNEWEIIRSQPLSDQELADKKGLALGSLALALEDPVNFAATLAAYQLTDLPLTELDSYQQGIEGLTSADIQKAATTYLSDQPIIVVVGNAELLKPQLEPLGEIVEVE